MGRQSLIFRDASRTDPLAPNPEQGRRLAVLVWYPAKRNSTGPQAEFTASLPAFADIAIGLGLDAPRQQIIDGLGLLRPNVLLHVPIADRISARPLILLSHGFNATTEEYDSLAEDLASHGFVVVGVNHTYASLVSMYLPHRPTTRVPGETDVRIDLQSALYNPIHDQWTTDLRFVLTQMLALNSDRRSPLFNRIDPCRIGAMGHSFGGSASVTAAFTDWRIRCAINIDGAMWGLGLTSTPNKPAMFLQAQGSRFDGSLLPANPGADELARLGVTSEQYQQARDFKTRSDQAVQTLSTAGGAWIVVSGAVHQAFSDFALIGQVQTGTIDPARLREITRRAAREFFQRQFYGVGTPLLTGAASDVPEVSVVRPLP